MALFDDLAPAQASDRPMLLTVEDLAEQLQVSKRTIWRLRSACQLPTPVKIGGAIRWRSQDIQNWIAQGCPNARQK